MSSSFFRMIFRIFILMKRYFFANVIALLIVFVLIYRGNIGHVNNKMLEYVKKLDKFSIFESHKIVHIDLKGAPPKIDYLIEVLKIIKENGGTGILIEYEDMFPFEYSYNIIRNKDCYSKSELRLLFDEANKLNLLIIPLIQTFGHFEYVLKHEKFSSLAETKDNKELCPLKNGSINLVIDLVEQILDFHGPIDYIHLGGDEVNLKICNICTDNMARKEDLHYYHMSAIIRHVGTITQRKTKVIMWDDMFRSNDYEFISKFDSEIMPMVWDYTADPSSKYIVIKKLLQHFNKIWIATSFKGADGKNRDLPDFETRMQNHINWMDLIIKKRLSPHIKGIVLTGWSRYNGKAPLCEVLPVSIPSLISSLRITKGKHLDENFIKFAKDFYENRIEGYCQEFLHCNTALYMVKITLGLPYDNKIRILLRKFFYPSTIEEWLNKDRVENNTN